MSFDVEIDGFGYNHDSHCELKRNGGMTCGNCDTPYCYCLARLLTANRMQSELHAAGRVLNYVQLWNDFGYVGPMDKWPDDEAFLQTPIALLSAFADTPEQLIRMANSGQLQMINLDSLEELIDGD